MDSYNSRYPVEYYEIGTPYMFYTDSTVIGNRNKLASVDLIQEYSDKFLALQKDKELSTGLKKNTSSVFGNLSRYVGFVVDITDNIIHVLYQCRINGVTEFRVTQYITSNSQKVFTDDLEKIAPSLFVDKTNLIGVLSSKYTDTRTTVSGITKADNTDKFTEPFVSKVSGVTNADNINELTEPFVSKVSGVTKADKSNAVSGVTKANKSDAVSGVTKADNIDELTEPFVSKVSGVTKADKSNAVSGVTKADKSDAVSGITKADKSNAVSGVTKAKHNL